MEWKSVMAGAIAVCAMTSMTVLLPQASAAPKPQVVKIKGSWKVIPSAAGTYRVSVACPKGTRPAGGSVSFQELRGATPRAKTFESLPAGMWPERSVGGGIGQTSGNRVYAELILEKGPRLKARVTARCQR